MSDSPRDVAPTVADLDEAIGLTERTGQAALLARAVAVREEIR